VTLKLAVVMDPVGSINIKKDSTFAMLLEAQTRRWTIYYLEQSDIYLHDGEPCARMRSLAVRDDPQDWYTLTGAQDAALTDMDVILMRKDPPFDME
jgi:glutathione synthase